MAIHAVKTDRMDITWDLSSGYIFVQQKWRYNWIDESGSNPWTLQEKRDFHNRADKWIWELWSSQAYAMITGNSNLARRYRNTKFKVNVDIKWVVGSENEHWNVEVRKVNRESNVNWHRRRIQLHWKEDILGLGAQGSADPSITYVHVGVGHEFGHAFGNTSAIYNGNSRMHGDEYMEPGLSQFMDDASIMSAGSNVRQRHFDYLKNQLKQLINNDVDIYLY